MVCVSWWGRSFTSDTLKSIHRQALTSGFIFHEALLLSWVRFVPHSKLTLTLTSIPLGCIFQKSGRPIEGQCPHPKKVQAGTCLKVTRACNKMFRPVCGCDGKTYSNYSCTLGHNIKHEGHCWYPPLPVFNCITIWNQCFDLYRLVSVTCWWVSLEWMFLNWNTATTVSLKLLQSSILQSPHFRVVTAHISIQYFLTNINDAAYFRPIIWTKHYSFHQ